MDSHIFLGLGKQPIANNFLTADQIEGEYTFDLRVKLDYDTKLVSLVNFVPPEKMFHDNYAYRSSLSQTMREHFEDIARIIDVSYSPEKILEIGSDDGVFIKHFDTDVAFAVEPCGNFCDMTNEMGYKTFKKFWTNKVAEELVCEIGKMDVVFAANCMCHIQTLDDTFEGINTILNDDGIFVFEDPSLFSMFERTSYDQIYDEHAHIFSVTALKNVLTPHGLEIFRVDNLSVHGGSNRIWVKKKYSRVHSYHESVITHLVSEQRLGVNYIEPYNKFGLDVKRSKDALVELLKTLKDQGKMVVSYGATSKSTTVFNYCGIDINLITHIFDTTPEKQGKLLPGVHIPVVSYNEKWSLGVDYAFLGAWNYEKEIMNKESEYVERGGKFISHVPTVRVLP